MIGGAVALLSLPLTMSGGLRLDTPDDAAPPVTGVLLDLRLFMLPEAYTGVEITYGGGVDTRNPEKVRACGKLEATATLGWRPLFQDDTVFASLGARAGLTRVDGWPRGTLPPLARFGPALGAEVGLGWFFARPWGHPMGLEARVGYGRLRLDSVWVGDPSVGVFVTGRLLPEPVPAPELAQSVPAPMPVPEPAPEPLPRSEQP